MDPQAPEGHRIPGASRLRRNKWWPVSLRGMLPGAASATESKEFKRVKQKIEVSSAVFGYFDVVDWAVIQRFGDAAINAGEMVSVPFDRGIEGFTVG